MAWNAKITVTKKQWLSQPAERWNAGLMAAGMNFRTGLARSHYPPLAPSGWTGRRYGTADKADFRIEELGKVMSFGSTSYLPYILGGTKYWVGWPGKANELLTMMSDGFLYGIKNYVG